MGDGTSFWILKPPNASCGNGIEVVNDFEDLPKLEEVFCVQRYMKQPLLINAIKFDLRVYVLVTSVDPLRVYLYQEGLTRWPISVRIAGGLIYILCF